MTDESTEPASQAPGLRARLFIGLGVMVLALVYGSMAWGFSLGIPGRPGPGVFPRVVGVALGLTGLVVVVTSSFGLLREARRHTSPVAHVEPAATNAKPWYRSAGFLFCLAVIVYTTLFEVLGFLLAGVIALTLASFAFQEKRRPWWYAPLIGLVLAVVFDFLFREVFGVQLPDGVFGISTGGIL